jgi:hypothetical protein
MPKGVIVFYCLFLRVLWLCGFGGKDVSIGDGDTFTSQYEKVVFMELSTPLLMIGIICGMAFLVFVSLAILDQLEELRINR